MSVSARAAAPPTSGRAWIRRGELLDATRRVVEARGFHAATVSDIVQAAGLSQGAFYLYFPDKKAIFAALQEEMASLLRRRIYWASRDEPAAAHKLRAGLRSYFEFYADYRQWNRRLATEGLGIEASFESRHRVLYDSLAEAFRPTLEELRVENPLLCAFSLIGMATQLAYWRHFHEGAPALSPEQLAQACAGLFLNGARANVVQGDPHA